MYNKYNNVVTIYENFVGLKIFQYRLVVKTALKLLLVFVEYTESNSLLLLSAISKVEKANSELLLFIFLLRFHNFVYKL